MGQLELAQIPVEGWVIDPYEHDLLDGPGNAVCFPTHNGETALMQCPEVLLCS